MERDLVTNLGQAFAFPFIDPKDGSFGLLREAKPGYEKAVGLDL